MLRAVLIGSALTVGTLAHAGTFLNLAPPETAGSPYSAEVVTSSTTTFADGNQIVRSKTVRVYRDSQGRTRIERPAASVAQPESGGTANVVIIINDPVSRERIVLNPAHKIANVVKLPAGAMQPAAAAEADMPEPFGLMGLGMGIGANRFTEASSNTTSLGQKTLDGLNVTGTRDVRVIPAGTLGNKHPITSTIEEWVSPDLGVSVQVTSNSSVGGQVSLNLQNLSRSEPDAALFKVPAGYTQHSIDMGKVAANVVTTEAR